MSHILPGDVGFAGGIKASAQDLADGLGITPIIDPTPADYDYIIIYDTPHATLLGIDLPKRYALFDHHVPGGHRFSNFQSELVADAEWCWVAPLEATCAVLTDLFVAHQIPITDEMGLALAAGIVTDTSWLRLANGSVLRRLAYIFEACGLYYEDLLAVLDSPNRNAERRTAILAALRNTQEQRVGQWSILAAQTDSHDYGFAVIGALARLGGDVRIVAFPKNGETLAMIECDAPLITDTDLDMTQIIAAVAKPLNVSQTWGTAMWGRIIAPLSAPALLNRCAAAVAQGLQHTNEEPDNDT